MACRVSPKKASRIIATYVCTYRLSVSASFFPHSGHPWAKLSNGCPYLRPLRAASLFACVGVPICVRAELLKTDQLVPGHRIGAASGRGSFGIPITRLVRTFHGCPHLRWVSRTCIPYLHVGVPYVHGCPVASGRRRRRLTRLGPITHQVFSDCPWHGRRHLPDPCGRRTPGSMHGERGQPRPELQESDS